MEINNGLFIPLYDLDSLELYLNNGVYGFLTKPFEKDEIDGHSNYFKILADYGCTREGTHIFFFIGRKIIYGGVIKGNKDIGSFYLNGKNSPLGRKCNADLIWDETDRYTPSDKPGVFEYQNKVTKEIKEGSQPFIIKFETNEVSGKYVISDDFYFELGSYPYPMPSNAIQKLGFCTLTPGEVKIAYELIEKSNNYIQYDILNKKVDTILSKNLFKEEMINPNHSNESELEFNIVSDFRKKLKFLNNHNYCVCRQVPICPFKPENIDRADVCLYDLDSLIREGTMPNILIELKKEIADYKAYAQVVRYLKWLEKNNSKEDFDKIEAYIIAPRFTITHKKLAANKLFEYANKIKLYSSETESFVDIK